MNYLNQSEKYLRDKHAIHTAKEIAGQPLLWKQTADKFFAQAEIIGFLHAAFKEADHIILTGAGSSSFIGNSLSGVFFKCIGKLTRPIATTDIVSHPLHYFDSIHIPLIISFARSGNSPESCAALELADRFCRKCFHLIITCDKSGDLAAYHSKNPVLTFVLPPQANDKGLAMTGSYSSMLLTGLLIAYLEQQDFCKGQLALNVAIAENLLKNGLSIFSDIVQKDFLRAVFLGSGGLFGTAREAALKLQELTNGRIICTADTYLGFRHGPKAVIDNHTLVVYLLNNNNYVLQYEKDLVLSMRKGNSALFQMSISDHPLEQSELNAQINLSMDSQPISENFLSLCSILPCQLIGFFKSLQLGLTPDNPSINGAISRVVEGVHIYPLEI